MPNADYERDPIKVNIWETLSHRWVVRDARTAQIPAGETYRGHDSKQAAIRSVRKRGWEFSVFEAQIDSSGGDNGSD